MTSTAENRHGHGTIRLAADSFEPKWVMKQESLSKPTPRTGGISLSTDALNEPIPAHFHIFCTCPAIYPGIPARENK
ncbi:DUF4113 domain-containing protein [Mucilaginibacter sabulilitoris]|uniref:DUF4113 domain-containing protein n=1 Tax=Mucilaginibacter sabulilitoris TaxID=1173583 RepID=UPI0038993998